MNDYAYIGFTPVETGGRVSVCDMSNVWHDNVEVHFTLAAQFHTEEHGYFLYADKGVTWKPLR